MKHCLFKKRFHYDNILSVEHEIGSEVIRFGCRRILVGFVPLLGGCGTIVFDIFSIASLSDTRNKKS